MPNIADIFKRVEYYACMVCSLIGFIIGLIAQGNKPHIEELKIVDSGRYPVTINRVIDGDTVVADISLPLGIHLNDSIRLNGIDAPDDDRKPIARNNLLRLTEGQTDMRLQIDGRDKYGRILGVLFNKDGLNINQQMIDDNQAVEYHGGKKI